MDVSVIVCAHNEERHLPAQLDALTSQDYDGAWEIVVVDNRSTDGTRQVVETHAAADPRLRIVAAETRPDKSYAMQVGVENSSGRLLAFCDADDIVGSRWLPAIASGLEGHAIITGPHEVDRLNPEWLARSRGSSNESEVGSFAGIFPHIRGASWGIRREVWEQLGGMRDDYHPVEDIEFSLRAWLAGIEIVGVPQAVVHYRYRASGRTLWKQGFAYGRGRPRIARLLKDAGRPTPRPLSGWKSWVLLVARLPTIGTREGRALWAWIAGNRCGQVVGSIQERTIML